MISRKDGIWNLYCLYVTFYWYIFKTFKLFNIQTQVFCIKKFPERKKEPFYIHIFSVIFLYSRHILTKCANTIIQTILTGLFVSFTAKYILYTYLVSVIIFDQLKYPYFQSFAFNSWASSGFIFYRDFIDAYVYLSVAYMKLLFCLFVILVRKFHQPMILVHFTLEIRKRKGRDLKQLVFSILLLAETCDEKIKQTFGKKTFTVWTMI